MKHSDAPWTLGTERTSDFVLLDAELNRICFIPRSRLVDDSPDPEQKANARLIAAAPKLLEALQDLVARCDGSEGVRADGSNIQTIKAHAAIAEAIGE